MSVKIIEKFRSIGRKTMPTQKKMASGLSLTQYGHIGYTLSLKPGLNVRSFKWVNSSFKRDTSFT